MLRLIFAILLLLVLFLLVRSRQSTRAGAKQGEESQAVTAAEADPTSTGRYRVQKMLAKQATQQKAGLNQSEVEEENLPDPFNGPSTGSKESANPSQTKK